MYVRCMMAVILLSCFSTVTHADSGEKLSLNDACAQALQNSPLLRGAKSQMRAEERVVTENRAGYFPQISADATSVHVDQGGTHVTRDGVEQQLGTYITAGALSTSTVLDREAAGIQVKQLVSDFGKTGNRVASAKASLRAAEQQYDAARATVLLNVIEAYFKTLQAQATQQIAQKTVGDRQLEFEKISLLAKAQAKSNLDVSFASVALEQSKVLLLQAQNDYNAKFAELAFAMGLKGVPPNAWQLIDAEVLPEPSAIDIDDLIARADKARPELARQRAIYDAARSKAAAEKAGNFPTLEMLAAAGKTFSGDSRLPDRYGAIGLNINMPLFAGGYYQAKQAEAEYRAAAALDDLANLENAIARDVRTAWLNVQAGRQALTASERLRHYAEQSLELAQSRYNLGLSSIVELNNAELNAIDAELKDVQSRYEYQLDLARLAYQSGSI